MHVVATAGHVDHGKSALIRALTGMEPDRYAEERRRGLTIDLGFAWTTLRTGPDAETRVAFVDVPGHERFIATTLAGLGPVPVVLFVVAADSGWMPQSEEHLAALHGLDVRHGLLVITRADLADPEPARRQAKERLAAGSLAGIDSVCVSARTGRGLDALRAALAGLLARLPAPQLDAPVRLWIDRAFTVRGAGTVVTGTLPGGRVRSGDELVLSPCGRSVLVRGIQTLRAPADEVSAVARVAVNLRNVDVEAADRGHALLTPGRWRPTELLDARLHPERVGLLPARYPPEVTVHLGSAAVPAGLRPLGPDTVRLRLSSPLPLRIGDRGLVRDPGSPTLLVGFTALDVAPPPLRRRGAAARRADELAAMTGRPDLAAELRRRRVVRAAELTAMGVDAPGDRRWLIDPQRVPGLATRLREALTRHDRDDPLRPGVTAEAARVLLGLPDRELLGPVVAASGLQLRDGRVVAGRRHLPERVQAAVAQLREDMSARPFLAPEADRLRALGLGRRELAAATDAGGLLRLAEGVYLLPGSEAAALEPLARLPTPFTVADARRAWGTTRRVAVPLLELLARRGDTRRTDRGRHELVRRGDGW